MQKQTFRLLWVAGCSVLFAAGVASAQNYPSKPVRLVVPFAAGGGTDTTARVMAAKVIEAWGQQIIVDNRTGAGGMIGADVVAKSPPDGYTVLMSSLSEVSINQNVYKKMTYNPEKDLMPVTLAATTPLLFVVHPSLPAKSVRELIALAKSRPGEMTYSTPGVGSVQHLGSELFALSAKVKLVHVPYKGGAPAVVAVVGGEVSATLVGMPPAMPQVKAGRLRALAVSTKKRSPAVPDVPTMTEAAGIADFDVSNWFGVYVPAGTPAAVISRLNTEMVRALRDEGVKKRLEPLGAEAVGNSVSEFTTFWHNEIKKYASVIKSAKVQAN